MVIVALDFERYIKPIIRWLMEKHERVIDDYLTVHD